MRACPLLLCSQRINNHSLSHRPVNESCTIKDPPVEMVFVGCGFISGGRELVGDLHGAN